MTRAIALLAPAKINWSLEILRARPDGYHEIRTVLQTIDLHDTVTLEDDPSGGIGLTVTGEAGLLAKEEPEANLAHRAAVAMRNRLAPGRGVRIRLEKRIPIAAGLGGGSTDAAAVIRGLDRLWGLATPRANLIEIAGEVGSDPPFFVVGGTAVASGRGEVVEPLRDAVAPSIMLAVPQAGERAQKTGRMFSALTADHYSEGDVTIGVRETVDAGRMLHDEMLNNVFEHVVARLQPETEKAMEALRADGYAPRLCGAGPSFFLLYSGGADQADLLGRRIRDTGFAPFATYALRREQALRMDVLGTDALRTEGR